jgi:hypothetical protein
MERRGDQQCILLQRAVSITALYLLLHCGYYCAISVAALYLLLHYIYYCCFTQTSCRARQKRAGQRLTHTVQHSSGPAGRLHTKFVLAFCALISQSPTPERSICSNPLSARLSSFRSPDASAIHLIPRPVPSQTLTLLHTTHAAPIFFSFPRSPNETLALLAAAERRGEARERKRAKERIQQEGIVFK